LCSPTPPGNPFSSTHEPSKLNFQPQTSTSAAQPQKGKHLFQKTSGEKEKGNERRKMAEVSGTVALVRCATNSLGSLWGDDGGELISQLTPGLQQSHSGGKNLIKGEQ
jgi:hypothetical protein